jgi:hypothetical protein
MCRTLSHIFPSEIDTSLGWQAQCVLPRSPDKQWTQRIIENSAKQ